MYHVLFQNLPITRTCRPLVFESVSLKLETAVPKMKASM